MCKVLEVSKSGFYKWLSAEPSAQEKHREFLKKRITWHFFDNKKRYGSPRIADCLWKEGIHVSERTVASLMREMGLKSCMSKKYRVSTTDSNHNLPIAPNLLNQNFAVSAPNKVWVADITYVPCREGKLYLASVLDLCTKQIVGWKLGSRMTEDLVLDALKQAYKAKKPKKGLIHHSDRGSQYASKEYRNQLDTYKMQASMSRKGNCYDNACIEAFHSSIKRELIYCTSFRTKAQAYDEIYEYIELFYNRKRVHSSLGYMSPVQFEARFYKKKA